MDYLTSIYYFISFRYLYDKDVSKAVYVLNKIAKINNKT